MVFINANLNDIIMSLHYCKVLYLYLKKKKFNDQLKILITKRLIQ